ncbi:dolichyl-phosphate beta-glucosyltransferase-like [Drosophila grimshawi]|uniref:dolichyl-phosphate beta-glucosyltransferase-like n=1 Tax=Drosophila grimshawi TaxID=7222 RepID=UPI001C933FA6|nr:dolichyl-phosphate beta-glucosyltransferase-like [Drosophila grimshawi]
MLALLLQLFCYLVAFILATVLLMVLVLLYKTKPYPIITRHKDEKFYLDPKTIKTIEFPSLDEPPTLELSVIVPT